MTSNSLRTVAPSWNWVAVRDGFGWIYKGAKRVGIATFQVTVQRCSVIENAELDAYRTTWFVYPTGEQFNVWLFKQVNGVRSNEK